MLNKQEVQAIIDKVGSYTRHYATVTVHNSEQGVTRFANSEISQNVSIEDTVVRLTVYNGKKEATCTTNVVSDEGLCKLAQDADGMLPMVPDGEFDPFPASQENIQESVSDGRLSAAFDITQRAEHIRQGVASLETGYTAAGALSLNRTAFAFGNNQGAFRFAAFDDVQFNTVVTHADSASGATGASGSGECMAYEPDHLDIGEAFAKAQKTAKMAHNPIPVDLGAYTVILSPVALGDLMMFVSMPLCAKWLDEGESFAIGQLGKRVFGDNITLRDDVKHPGTLPLYFDYEGNNRRPTMLIENGVIKNFLYDNKTAARHHTETTGHAVSNKGYGGYPQNLIMDGGNCTLEEMIADTPKGIYISELHYTNYVNPRSLQVTGLTRNGTFLIENGKLTKAVSTLRFTQNLIDALSAVTAITRDRVKVNGDGSVMLMPAARMDGFHFTSKQ